MELRAVASLLAGVAGSFVAAVFALLVVVAAVGAVVGSYLEVKNCWYHCLMASW